MIKDSDHQDTTVVNTHTHHSRDPRSTKTQTGRKEGKIGYFSATVAKVGAPHSMFSRRRRQKASKETGRQVHLRPGWGPCTGLQGHTDAETHASQSTRRAHQEGRLVRPQSVTVNLERLRPKASSNLSRMNEKLIIYTGFFFVSCSKFSN